MKTIVSIYSILTMMCDLSKYLIAVPMADKSAKTIARAIFEQFILTFGPMKSIRTDLGTEFKNEVMTELSTLLKIKHNTSTAYRGQEITYVEITHIPHLS